MTDDLISRQDAIDVLEERLQVSGYSNVALVSELNRSIGYLMRLPSVQPERKTGRWIHQAKFGRVECDQCGKVFRNTFAPKNFCPNCGADMRDEQRLQYVDSDTLQGGLMSAT